MMAGRKSKTDITMKQLRTVEKSQYTKKSSPDDTPWSGIRLTKSAVKHIRSVTGRGEFLHFSVKRSGCTGHAYAVGIIQVAESTDIRFDSNGATIYVALDAMPFLDGTEIDFTKQGVNQSFVYQNPNVTSMCGCGESFGV